MTQIRETFIQIEPQKDGDDKRYHIGESEWYEPFVRPGSTLYRTLTESFGRCTGKMHRDGPFTGETEDIGWVFLKRKPYDDDRSKTYLQETWVQVKEVA